MSEIVNLTSLRETRSKMSPDMYEVDHDRNDQANIYAGERREWIALLPHQCLNSIEAQQESNAAGLVAEHNAIGVLIEAVRTLLVYNAAKAKQRASGDAAHELYRARIDHQAALAKVSL